MSQTIRLVPHMYLFTPLGVAEAHFLWMPDGYENSISYGCFICETKENWWFANTQVRICESVSNLRSDAHTPIYVPDDLYETLKPHILRHKKSPLYARAAAENAEHAPPHPVAGGS